MVGNDIEYIQYHFYECIFHNIQLVWYRHLVRALFMIRKYKWLNFSCTTVVRKKIEATTIINGLNETR